MCACVCIYISIHAPVNEFHAACIILHAAAGPYFCSVREKKARANVRVCLYVRRKRRYIEVETSAAVFRRNFVDI